MSLKKRALHPSQSPTGDWSGERSLILQQEEINNAGQLYSPSLPFKRSLQAQGTKAVRPGCCSSGLEHRTQENQTGVLLLLELFHATDSNPIIKTKHIVGTPSTVAPAGSDCIFNAGSGQSSFPCDSLMKTPG